MPRVGEPLGPAGTYWPDSPLIRLSISSVARARFGTS